MPPASSGVRALHGAAFFRLALARLRESERQAGDLLHVRGCNSEQKQAIFSFTSWSLISAYYVAQATLIPLRQEL